MKCVGKLPRMGNPGNSLPIDEIALRATGLVAFPLTPPYVVVFSIPTAGHGIPFDFSLIKPDMVFMAATPQAPPKANKFYNLFFFKLISFTNFRSSCYRNNVGYVRSEFYEEWYVNSGSNPPRNSLDQYGILRYQM